MTHALIRKKIPSFDHQLQYLDHQKSMINFLNQLSLTEPSKVRLPAFIYFTNISEITYELTDAKICLDRIEQIRRHINAFSSLEVRGPLSDDDVPTLKFIFKYRALPKKGKTIQCPVIDLIEFHKFGAWNS